MYNARLVNGGPVPSRRQVSRAAARATLVGEVVVLEDVLLVNYTLQLSQAFQP